MSKGAYQETYSSVSLFDCNKPSSTNFARTTSSTILSSFRSVARRSFRAVSSSCRTFLPRLTDPSARRTGCDYYTRVSDQSMRHFPCPDIPKPIANRCGSHKNVIGARVRKQKRGNAEAKKKRRPTCNFAFCGSEAIHSSTRALTFSTSTSRTPSPATMATMTKYSAIVEGDEARVASSRPVIVVSTCSFFILSFL